VPVVENRPAVEASLRTLADAVAAGVDLGALEVLTRRAPALHVDPVAPARRMRATPVPVAVLTGPAFGFSYPDNLERLVEAGAELVGIDPATDAALPQGVQGLYACGGFPEVFAAELAANRPLLRDVADKIHRGLVVWAECGGLLWLSESLDGHRLCGAIPTSSTLGTKVTVGYRTATLLTDSPIGPKGTVVRGHEHHYSSADPPGSALKLVGRAGTRLEGWADTKLLATYLHLHLGGDPAPAEHFVASATATPQGEPLDRPSTSRGREIQSS